MKLLLDQNISFRLVSKLDDRFPGTEQVKRLGLYNKSDREIWEFAKANDFIIVSFDSDFFDLSIAFGHPPKLIWLKSNNQSTRFVQELLLSKEEQIDSFYLDPETKLPGDSRVKATTPQHRP